MNPNENCFRLDDRVIILPVVHASGAYARAVEEWLLNHDVDCIAVPLPPSFGEAVCEAVQKLPIPSMVLQQPTVPQASEAYDAPWKNEDDGDGDRDAIDDRAQAVPYSYVPIDPSQSVITAIRFALGEHIPVRFVDLEVARFHEITTSLPDAFALR
jgi:hypothetical protein